MKIIDFIILIVSLILIVISPFTGSEHKPVQYELKEGVHVKGSSKNASIDVTDSQLYSKFIVQYSNGSSETEPINIYVKVEDVENVKDVSYFQPRNIFSWHLMWSFIIYFVVAFFTMMIKDSDSNYGIVGLILSCIPACIVGVAASIDYMFM